MARIFMTGLEAGSLAVFDGSGGSPSISTAQKRTGAYSLLCNDNYVFVWKMLPGAYGELYGRFGVYPLNRNYDALFFALMDNRGGVTHLSFTVDDSYLVQVRRGIETGSILATGTTPLVPNSWQCFEFHVVIDDSDGVVQTKINDLVDINFSGDTRNGGNATIDKVHIGGTGLARYMGAHFDDIAINDVSGAVNNSWIGRGGIYGLRPSGAGAHTDFTPSAGANYECVDEVPPNDDTDYVESDVVGHQDTYAMTDLPVTTGAVAAVQWLARAKLDATGDGNFQRQLRHSGVDYNGGDLAVDVSYKYFAEIFDQAPDGTGWTIAKVNALEAGMKVS